MKINFGSDVGIPLGVGAADVLLSYIDEKRIGTDPNAFQFEPLLGPVGSVAGIGMMAAGYWPESGQVIAHASMPLAVRAIYSWAKQQGWFSTGVSRTARRATAVPAGTGSPVRSVGWGYPAPSQKPEFSSTPVY